ECFDNEVWIKAFDKFGLDMETEAQKEFKKSDILPWEHLGGPDKASLLKHYKEAIDKVES
ncbi:MAG: hypothetical protein ACYSRQ_05235, partial [Planctomycetota bacterium]